MADFIKVQKFLGGIRYPATKQQLVDQARGNQADDEALTTLSGMPEREYSGPDEVSRAIQRLDRGAHRNMSGARRTEPRSDPDLSAERGWFPPQGALVWRPMSGPGPSPVPPGQAPGAAGYPLGWSAAAFLTA